VDKILLIGAGGHSRSCIDVIESSGSFKVAGLVEKKGLESETNLGYPIIGSDEDLTKLRNNYEFAIVTVGQIKSNKTRTRLFNILKDLDYKLPVIISPKSHISNHSIIGEGTIIMHNVIVNANSKIGHNCIINNNSLIEHDSNVGDHCHVATGAIINGNVIVGENTFIGSGVVTKESISIGDNCIIGAGSIIKNNINSGETIIDHIN